MVLLKDGTEIDENFGTNGITDIKKVINHFTVKIKYLEDDYILGTYIKDCITSRDLQFVNDLETLLTFLRNMDTDIETLKKRYNNKNIQKPRELESDIIKLEKAKEIMQKYSKDSNNKVAECVKTLNKSIDELKKIKVELKSYIFKHKGVRKLTRNSHFEYYGNHLLAERINYFKPNKQTIKELINNNMIYIKGSIQNDYIDIQKLEQLLSYLKDTYYIQP